MRILNWSFAYVETFKARGGLWKIMIPCVWVYGKLREVLG